MKTKPFAEKGQVLIIFALAAIGLFALVGLAIDGSKKFSDQRRAQNAADTAALAAALAKVDVLTIAKQMSDTTICPSASPSAACTALLNAGFSRAQSNGYDGNLVTNVVEIYSPPKTGPYSTVANKDQYIQVIITSYVQTTFMRVLGINRATNIVQAVAYASPGYNLHDGAMIISYDPDPNCSTGGTGGYSVQVSGSAKVNLHGGGILINSDEVCGFKIPNCADLNIFGGAGINSVADSPLDNIDTTGCTFDPPVTEKFDQNPIKIPEDVNNIWPGVPTECGFAAPNPTNLYTSTLGPDGKWHEEWLIHPGFYTSFPPSQLIDEKRSYIYMKSGVYCIDPPMDQDLSWSPVDAALLNGSTETNSSKVNYNKYASLYNTKGVTLYIKAGGGFSINASSPTFLDATNDPSSKYQGYLIVLEGIHTAHPSCTVNGGADIYLNGLIFAPYCDITINGQAGETANINAQLIGWDIKINGTNEVTFYYNPDNLVKIKRKVGLMR